MISVRKRNDIIFMKIECHIAILLKVVNHGLLVF